MLEERVELALLAPLRSAAFSHKPTGGDKVQLVSTLMLPTLDQSALVVVVVLTCAFNEGVCPSKLTNASNYWGTIAIAAAIQLVPQEGNQDRFVEPTLAALVPQTKAEQNKDVTVPQCLEDIVEDAPSTLFERIVDVPVHERQEEIMNVVQFSHHRNLRISWCRL